MKITRTYKHREHGDIGEVTLELKGSKILMDGKELPESSIRHLLTFSGQSLQDAYAGQSDQAGCIGAFTKKYDALVNGTIGVRTGGVSDLQKVCRQIARKALKLQVSKEEFKKFTDKESAEQNEILDKIVDKNRDTIEESAKAEIKRREMEAKRQAELASGVKIDL